MPAPAALFVPLGRLALFTLLAITGGGCGRPGGDEAGPGAGTDADLDADSVHFVDPAAVPGTNMDLRAAAEFFPALKLLKKKGGRMTWDDQAWLVLKPDQSQTYPWPEHADGKLSFATNNLGFREDAPTDATKHGYRILVVGDSHTEGAVNNDESWPNVLERLLNAPDPKEAGTNAPRRAPVEVLNAGVGGTGPHNYFGMLRKHLDLQPDMCIAGLYAGNDFENALQINDFYTKHKAKPRDQQYSTRFQAASKGWPEQVPQGFNQAFYLNYAPNDTTRALDGTVAVFEELARLCKDRGIRFVVVVIPTKPEVDIGDDEATTDGILAALEITRVQLAINRRLGDRFALAMEEQSIPCIHARVVLRSSTDAPLYWRKDHHLNVTGHKQLAQIVFERIAPFAR